MEFKDHNLAAYPTDVPDEGRVRYERRPVKGPRGEAVEGLYAAWIVLDNPGQMNSYTTSMVKQVILGFRRASNERDVVAVVFTGEGDRAFCTGGNTKEYAEYYSGRPEEYRQYMRLFNDMVTSILECDKPVICRVNGMRIAGGQEIGMACDFTVASDLANFGQSGPKHGSAPDGGSTDFLALYTGVERANESLALCTPWSAYRALDYGLITEVARCLRVDGDFIANPFVVTDRYVQAGRKVFGEFVTGDARKRAKELLMTGEVDLVPLDDAVDRQVTALMMTFPGCVTRTLQSARQHKRMHWDKNREQNRAWLGLNMMTEAHLGFRAFNEGPRGNRQVDFVAMRQRLAAGEDWTPEFIDSLIPRAREPAGAGS
jgi:6-oxo-cyclohex-1-ene-carbonyl-CoA hydrolase